MCRIDVNVKINSTDNAWVVDLEKKATGILRHFLSPKMPIHVWKADSVSDWGCRYTRFGTILKT